MEVTVKSRRLIRLHSALFYVTFLVLIGLLGWLSTRYEFEADWTASGRNTLSKASQDLVTALEGPVNVTAYARENQMLRGGIRELISRYQRADAEILLEFVNPDTHPDQVRQLGISVDGELVISYQGRSENIRDLKEESISNALQRLARQDDRFVVFLSGHGERKPDGQANHDLGNFGAELERKGIKQQSLALTVSPAIPNNTALLVIASPQSELLSGEVTMIVDYIERGGNLLWLQEPDGAQGLGPLAALLGVERLRGVVVDANTQLFGIRDPAFALVPEYPAHSITAQLDILTLFPQAVGLKADEINGWQRSAFLQTLPRSWAETSPMTGDEVRYEEQKGDTLGPLDIGYALTRKIPDDAAVDAATAGKSGEGSTKSADEREQRVVVVGDGDFLANAFLGNGGNLSLGLNLFNWLLHEDKLIAIEPRIAPDVSLNLSRGASIFISVGFLLVIPCLLLGSGVAIWWRRRRF